MEPRARASRHKGSLNFGDELKVLMHGAGATAHPDFRQPLPDGSSQRYLRNLPTENKNHPPTSFVARKGENEFPEPFPETLRVLDEIVTDYVIEMAHCALEVATHAGRAKLKLDDFLFAMRKDEAKLGRVYEMMKKARDSKNFRKGADGDAIGGMKMNVQQLQELADAAGEEGTGKGKGKGRGRRKKRGIDEVNGAPADQGEKAALEQINAGDFVFGDGAAEEDVADEDAGFDDLMPKEADEDGHRNKRARSEIDHD